MTLDVYEEATRLKDRYDMCGLFLEYLTDPDKTKGLLFNVFIKNFVEEYRDELLVFVNEQQVKAGMAFEELHCCPDGDDENSTEQENPV